MTQLIKKYSFADGYAVGELTGRLKYAAPTQVKQWVPLEKLKSFKSVLQKYKYAITSMAADPKDSTQVLLVAEKVGEGTDATVVLAFANGDDFMHGWEAGCLASRLTYTQPEVLEEWINGDNLEVIRQTVQDLGYAIAASQPHPDHKKWIQVRLERQIVA